MNYKPLNLAKCLNIKVHEVKEPKERCKQKKSK